MIFPFYMRRSAPTHISITILKGPYPTLNLSDSIALDLLLEPVFDEIKTESRLPILTGQMLTAPVRGGETRFFHLAVLMTGRR